MGYGSASADSSRLKVSRSDSRARPTPSLPLSEGEARVGVRCFGHRGRRTPIPAWGSEQSTTHLPSALEGPEGEGEGGGEMLRRSAVAAPPSRPSPSRRGKESDVRTHVPSPSPEGEGEGWGEMLRAIGSLHPHPGLPPRGGGRSQSVRTQSFPPLSGGGRARVGVRCFGLPRSLRPTPAFPPRGGKESDVRFGSLQKPEDAGEVERARARGAVQRVQVAGELVRAGSRIRS